MSRMYITDSIVLDFETVAYMVVDDGKLTVSLVGVSGPLVFVHADAVRDIFGAYKAWADLRGRAGGGQVPHRRVFDPKMPLSRTVKADDPAPKASLDSPPH